MSKKWKNFAIEEDEGSASCSQQRVGQREITTFCSIVGEFSIFCVASCNNNAIFVGFGLISLERLRFLSNVG